jgi:hypothetical protein
MNISLSYCFNLLKTQSLKVTSIARQRPVVTTASTIGLIAISLAAYLLTNKKRLEQAKQWTQSFFATKPEDLSLQTINPQEAPTKPEESTLQTTNSQEDPIKPKEPPFQGINPQVDPIKPKEPPFQGINPQVDPIKPEEPPLQIVSYQGKDVYTVKEEFEGIILFPNSDYIPTINSLLQAIREEGILPKDLVFSKILVREPHAANKFITNEGPFGTIYTDIKNTPKLGLIIDTDPKNYTDPLNYNIQELQKYTRAPKEPTRDVKSWRKNMGNILSGVSSHAKHQKAT